MQKITPCLWFDNQAEEAAAFYIAAFRTGQLTGLERYGDAGAEVSGQPKGSVMTVPFQLYRQDFIGLNGGPIFKFTPAVSFLVALETAAAVDAVWAKLSPGGSALMELGEYPFSRRYGWIQDKYGVSWQLMFTDQPITQRITPTLMFVGSVCGKAEEAIRFYASVFRQARVGDIMRYGGEPPDKDGTVKHAAFTLEGQEFAAMDSAYEHQFTFNEAISLMVNCDGQKEIDYYWGKLSAHPESEQCGWLKDEYGVSWQIVPVNLNALLSGKDPQQSEAMMKFFLQMKKIDIPALERFKAGL